MAHMLLLTVSVIVIGLACNLLEDSFAQQRINVASRRRLGMQL